MMAGGNSGNGHSPAIGESAGAGAAASKTADSVAESDGSGASAQDEGGVGKEAVSSESTNNIQQNQVGEQVSDQQQQQQDKGEPPQAPKGDSNAAPARASSTLYQTGHPLLYAPLGPEPDPLTDEEIRIVDETIAELLEATHAKTVAEVKCNIKPETIIMICERVNAFFMNERPLLELKAPINIVGDIHGQFLDLLRYFEVGGLPPNASYLFLGDYIDRGLMGVECTILLFCLKLRNPNQIHMLRGNHECFQISRLYGSMMSARTSTILYAGRQ